MKTATVFLSVVFAEDDFNYEVDLQSYEIPKTWADNATLDDVEGEVLAEIKASDINIAKLYKKDVIPLLQFDELSDVAKEKAREWYRSRIDGSDFMFESYTLLEFVQEIAPKLGIELNLKDIDYDLEPRSYVTITKAYINGWKLLDYDTEKTLKDYPDYQKIVNKWLELDVRARDTHNLKRIRDCLEYSINSKYGNVENRTNPHPYYKKINALVDEFALDIEDLINDLQNHLRKLGIDELEYVYSDQNVDECIRINEYTFLPDGTRYD